MLQLIHMAISKISYRKLLRVKATIYSILFLFATSLLCLSSPTYAASDDYLHNSFTSFAKLSADQMDPFSQNNILFYDPDGCETTTTKTGSCTTVSGDQITWIGDSYSVGAKDLITSAYPGVDLGPSIDDASSNIMVSKRFAGSDDSNPTGIQILESLKSSNTLRSVLVFALGTNDMGGTTQSAAEEQIEKVLEIAGSDTKVVFVNAKTGKDTNYANFNNALEEAKTEHSGQVFVADWASAVKDDTFSNDPDRIHPTGHYDAWLDTIKNAMPKSCSGGVGLLSGDGPEAVVWNYISEKYAAQYNFTPEILAGIMGNFQQESSFNPFATNGSMKGLYQSNNPKFKSYIESKFGDRWGQQAPQDVAEEALKAEIDYLMDESFGYNWNMNTESTKFTNLLDLPTNKSGEEGATAYTELFLATVEKAVGGSDPLLDPGVSSKFPRKYQHTEKRRENTRKFYQQYLQGGGAGTVTSVSASTPGTSTSSSTDSTTSGSSSFTWQDGWLTGGMPGWEKEDVSGQKLSESIKPSYTTPEGKPNKILLHSTEGTTIGFAAYPSGHKFPAHFIIDLKKKQVIQNLPITKPALASAASDPSTVQIEIVGFSTPSYIPNKSYYLQDFGDAEWDYLALLLIAISQETGISLTTSVDWNINYNNTGAVRHKDRNEFNNNVKGIVGHMHSPSPDTHIDPGPIWEFLEKAFARNPSAAAFANTSTGNTGSCDQCNNASGGYSSGGLSEAQAQQMADYYKSDAVSTSEWQLPSSYGKWNCVSFSAWFVQAFTTVGKRPGPWTYNHAARSFGHKLATEQNLQESQTPKPFSVFSITSGRTMCGDSLCGHTGIVVAVNGDDITTIEAAYGKVGYTAVKHRKPDYFVNTMYTNTFADLSPIMEMDKLREFFNGETIATTDSSGSVSTVSNCGSATSATPTGDDGAPCDPRTIDLGVTDDAYFSGENKAIRLCAIPNINQEHANADWADQFVKSGADTTHIHVNTRVSGSFYELGQKYMDSHDGKMLSASESYRTMARQEYFWNCYQCKCCNNGNLAGKPGYSNHQGGLAVDFKGEYDWLGQNVESVGLKQGISIGEPWHISLSGK